MAFYISESKLLCHVHLNFSLKHHQSVKKASMVSVSLSVFKEIISFSSYFLKKNDDDMSQINVQYHLTGCLYGS